jgi:hypothetical protein
MFWWTIAPKFEEWVKQLSFKTKNRQPDEHGSRDEPFAGRPNRSVFRMFEVKQDHPL